MSERALSMSATGQLENAHRPWRDKPVRKAVLNACSSGAWERVGGIPLVARSLYWVRKQGIEDVVILSSEGGVAERLGKWRGDIVMGEVVVQESTSSHVIPEAVLALPELDDWFLYIDCAHLLDPRFLHSLTDSRESMFACLGPADRQNGVIRAGLLNREDLEWWVKKELRS